MAVTANRVKRHETNSLPATVAGVQETLIGADEARMRFGDVIDRAWDGERFIVRRHTKDRVAVIGMREYERLRALEAAHRVAAAR